MKCGGCPAYGVKKLVLDGKPLKLCPADAPSGNRIRFRFEDSDCDIPLDALKMAQVFFARAGEALAEAIALREKEEAQS